MNLRVTDAENDPVTLSASSSNPTLVPDTNVSFAGAGEERTVTINATLQSTVQSATITVTADDGSSTSEVAFTTVVGTAAGSTITDTPGSDLLVGREGIDLLVAGLGHDVLCGNDEADKVQAGKWQRHDLRRKRARPPARR